jgi:ATP-dependent Zn protease
MNERRAYAVHEAGHAVVAWSLGWPVCAVWIAPEGERGSTEVKSEGISREDDAAICWAGEEATKLLNVEAPDKLGRGDWERFLNLTSRMEGDELERFRQDACARARKALNENRALLKVLADLLERDGAVGDVVLRRIT